MNNKKGMGFYKSPVDVRDFKLCAPANVTYPDSYIVPHLPKVKNQGMVNSCCAHVSSTILEYYSEGIDLSTDFIYGAEDPVCGENGMGMYPRNACEIMRQYGDATFEDCPTNTEIPNSTEIAKSLLNDAAVMERAANFKIDSYYMCNTDEDIKYALMNFGPVLCGVNWMDYSLDDEFVIEFHGQSYGGHALTILGWNKDGWFIQNSWGEEFGNHGRFILPFEYRPIEAWAIIDKPNVIDPALKRTSCHKVLAKVVNFVSNLRKKD